ncbi:HD domain-containing protein [Nitrosopumilus sp. K4]|uniref:HD domain-containing protein n=1 Tax=Nitrosopumilus sp. K4 TaxID=2795383 RepID=UPI001BAA141C|nr:HD domain-containing protein [Nitrosopumilus sp. K4]QUC65535.1 HD domain-containing protein [Nitrosopumilus sp. K4]
MTNLETAQKFAKEKHKESLKKDGITKHVTHLESVVSRLKGLGVISEDVLCAGWLHDVLENTNVAFDELFERFGQNVATTVMSLSKDNTLSKKEKEIQYTKQLKNASIDAKLIKLCDVSANLKEVIKSDISKTKKRKTINQMLHYLRIIKNDLTKNQETYPGIAILIDGINQIVVQFHQKPIRLN